jgi:hypothetical protein
MLADTRYANTGGRKHRDGLKFYYGIDFYTRLQLLEYAPDLPRADTEADFYLLGSFKRNTGITGPCVHKVYNRDRVIIPVQIIAANLHSDILGRKSIPIDIPDVSQMLGAPNVMTIILKPRDMQADIELKIGEIVQEEDVTTRTAYYFQLTNQMLKNAGMQVNWPEAMWNEGQPAHNVLMESLERILFHIMMDAKITNNEDRFMELMTRLRKRMDLYKKDGLYDPLSSDKGQQFEMMLKGFLHGDA